MIRVRAFSFLLLLAPVVIAQSTPSSSNVIVVVPVQEWLTANMNWQGLHQHPNGGKPPDQSSSLVLPTPYLVVFSPNGAVLYRGTDDAQNAAFINGLRGQLPPVTASAINGTGPTLVEYVNMVNELKPYKSQVLSGRDYIAFAVTNGDLTKSKLQDKAVDNFGIHTGIKLVELRLKFD